MDKRKTVRQQNGWFYKGKMKGVRERITVNKVVYVPLCFETPSELYNVCGKAFELAICL